MSRCSPCKTLGLKEVKSKEDFWVQFSPGASVFVNSTFMFLALEYNVSGVRESQGSICLSPCLRLFKHV